MLTPETTQRLQTEANIWLATVRPDGQPHLVPLWFAWHEGQIFLCTRPGSIKMRNLAHNPLVALSLESGTSPLICEGRAALIPPPWPTAVQAIFQAKYNWHISPDDAEGYRQLLAITPHKLLAW